MLSLGKWQPVIFDKLAILKTRSKWHIMVSALPGNARHMGLGSNPVLGSIFAIHKKCSFS